MTATPAIYTTNLPDDATAKVVERLFVAQIAAAVELGRRSVDSRRRPLAPFNATLLQSAWLQGRKQALEDLREITR